MDASLRNSLQDHGQEHLIRVLEQGSKTQQSNLEAEIAALDLDLLSRLHREALHPPTLASVGPVEPMSFSVAQEQPEFHQWISAGEQALAEGKAAAYLVAGGQGSRLGFEGPKGAFSIGLPSGKSLFALQAARLRNLQKRFGRPVPWCIMTSPLNHTDTLAHFEANAWFGLDREYLRFFPQGMLPALDHQGRILMESPDHLALVPDGNGGCFQVLNTSGTLDWLSQLGVDLVFLYGVDNCLVRPCDPPFLGMLATQPEMLSATKVVPRRSASERVGVFGLRDGLPGVIEYSDLPQELASATKEDGNLLFAAGNTAMHLFTRKALEQLRTKPLPYHTAHKKVGYWDHTAETVLHPAEPNAFKFEQFLFDSFPTLGKMLTYGVCRDSEFAPVKNPSGEDSPESAITLLGNLCSRWLRQSGCEISASARFEIDPLISYAGEGLSQAILETELGRGIRLIGQSA